MWSGAFASVYIITDPTAKPTLPLIGSPRYSYPNLNQSHSSCLNLTNQLNEGNQSKAKSVIDLVYSISMTTWSVIGYVSRITLFYTSGSHNWRMICQLMKDGNN